MPVRPVPVHDHGQRVRGATLSFVSYRRTSDDVVVNLTGYAVEAPLLNSSGSRMSGVEVFVTPLLGKIEVLVPASVSLSWEPGVYTYAISYKIGGNTTVLITYQFELIEAGVL